MANISDFALGASLFVGIVVFSQNTNDSYTLYRSSIYVQRVEVSNFASKEGERWNQTNCLMAADYFKKGDDNRSGDGGSLTAYWCEKGKYREVKDEGFFDGALRRLAGLLPTG